LNKRQRLELEKERKVLEAKDSYLKIHQFDYLYDKVSRVKRWVKSQQEIIDGMEKKMIEMLIQRKQKEERKWNKEFAGR